MQSGTGTAFLAVVIDFMITTTALSFKVYLFEIILLLTLFCFLVDMFKILLYGCLPGSTVISLSFVTNTTETKVFFSYYIPNPYFLKQLGKYTTGCGLLFAILFFLLKCKELLIVMITLSSVTFLTCHKVVYSQPSLVRYYTLYSFAMPTAQHNVNARHILAQQPITFLSNSKWIPYFCIFLGE